MNKGNLEADQLAVINKYSNTLKNSFNLGYFIHLYTDKLFYKDYYPLFIQDDFLESKVKCLNGEILNLKIEDRRKLIYNDYSNLNNLLIDEYNLNLELFYNEYIEPKTNIVEIPIDKLNLLIEQAGIIIENLTKDKNYIIDISTIK